MAVYTEISDDEIDRFVATYDIGTVVSLKGIAEGVENSNFLLVTEKGPHILTLYEKRVDPNDLPFFIGLMEHLARRGLTCPQPVRNRAGEGFALSRRNALSVPGWRPLFERSRERADSVTPGLVELIAAELDVLEKNWPTDLPAGVIHADLFPDNVFFLRGKLSGLIDFYFACNDFFAYDAAICLNAWCFEADGALNVTKARALLGAYEKTRPFSAAERAALPLLARGSALRFLLTRLYDWLNVPPGALVAPKDPLEYLRKLRFHQSVADVRAYGIEP